MYLKVSFAMVLIASIIKLVAIFNTNYDLFGDEAQYWIWSRDLNFGYYSKPPLLAWIIYIFTFLFGNSFEALKLISFLIYFLSSYVVYLITIELYKSKILGMFCSLSFYLLPAVSISSFLLSTDIILIFFWSLSLLFLLKIRKDPKLINFLLLGVFLGLSFLTKYAAIYFLISMIVVCFFDKKLKNIFLEKIFYTSIFVLSCFVILLPNIVWNIKNNWITLSHTSENASLNNIAINLLNGVEFFLTQCLMIGPVLFIFFIISIKKIKKNFETIFLLSFSLPIFLIVISESILVRANANWAAVALVPLMILIFNHAYKFSKKIIIINNFLNFSACCLLFFLISNTSSIKIFDRINGISKFSYNLKDEIMFEKKYLVVQDRLLFSNLMYLFRDTEKILLTPYNPKKEITSHFHITKPLPKEFNEDFIYLGDPDNLNYLIKKNVIKKIKTNNVLFKKRSIDIYEVLF